MTTSALAPFGVRAILCVTRGAYALLASKEAQMSLEAEFLKREREIDAGPKAEIERRRNALSEDMTLRREDALKQFIDRTNGVIRRIAEAEKFDIVFLEAAYSNARIDMTDRVIKALDAGR